MCGWTVRGQGSRRQAGRQAGILEQPRKRHGDGEGLGRAGGRAVVVWLRGTAQNSRDEQEPLGQMLSASPGTPLDANSQSVVVAGPTEDL